MTTNILTLTRPCEVFWKKLDDAPGYALSVLHQIAASDPDFGQVAGPDEVPVAKLTSAPEIWAEWFEKKSYVIGFSTQSDPVRHISMGSGTPGDMPSTLWFGGAPEIMGDGPRLKRLLTAAIPIWEAAEATVTVWDPAASERKPWLHWLKDGQEPTEFARRDMPEGWGASEELSGGILYLWPENEPHLVSA